MAVRADTVVSVVIVSALVSGSTWIVPRHDLPEIGRAGLRNHDRQTERRALIGQDDVHLPRQSRCTGRHPDQR